MTTIIELTEKEKALMDEAMERVDQTAAFLAGLPHEERLKWLREHRYSYPLSFEKEIGGTVYSVHARFSGSSEESAEQKVGRILSQI